MAQKVLVPELGYVNFPDDYTEEDRKRFIQQEIAKRMTVAPPAPKGGALQSGRETLKGIASSLIRDLGDIPYSAGSMLNSQGLKDLGGLFYDNPAIDALAPEQGYEDAYSRKIGEVAGNIGGYLIPGPSWLKAANAAVRGFSSAAADTARGIDQARTEGKQISPEEERQAAAISGGLGAAINMLPAHYFASKIPAVGAIFKDVAPDTISGVREVAERSLRDVAKRSLGGAAIGAGMNAAQQLEQNIVAQQYYDPNRLTGEGVGESTLVGGVAGGSIDTVLNLATRKAARSALARSQRANIKPAEIGQYPADAVGIRGRGEPEVKFIQGVPVELPKVTDVATSDVAVDSPDSGIVHPSQMIPLPRQVKPAEESARVFRQAIDNRDYERSLEAKRAADEAAYVDVIDEAYRQESGRMGEAGDYGPSVQPGEGGLTQSMMSEPVKMMGNRPKRNDNRGQGGIRRYSLDPGMAPEPAKDFSELATQVKDGKKPQIALDIHNQMKKLGVDDFMAVRLADEIVDEAGKPKPEANGVYFGDKEPGVITLALRGRETGDVLKALNHEGLHAMNKLGLITNAEMTLLKNHFSPGTVLTADEQDAYKRAYGDRYSDLIGEEAVAKAAEKWRDGQLKVAGRPQFLLKKIVGFVTGMDDVFKKHNLNTAEDVMDAFHSGKIGGRELTPYDAQQLRQTNPVSTREATKETVSPEGVNASDTEGIVVPDREQKPPKEIKKKGKNRPAPSGEGVIQTQPEAVAKDAGKFSIDPTKEAFYSQLEQTIDEKMPERATPDQILGIVNNPRNRVKAEEVRDTRLSDFLSGKDKVSKAEVLDYVRSKKPQIEMTGEVSNLDTGAMARVVELENQRDALAESHRQLSDDYVEANQAGRTEEADEISGHLENLERQIELIEREARDLSRANSTLRYEPWTIPGGRQYYESRFVSEPRSFRYSDGGPRNYRSSHWDDANVLSHARTKDRIDSEGKKVLHVEEIQSDWHQEGRKHGYGDKRQELRERITNLIDEITNKRIEYNAIQEDLWGLHVDSPERAKLRDKLDSLGSEIQALDRERVDLMMKKRDITHGGVPDAPYKQSWPEMTMRRMIDRGVKEGYDRIAWTPGEVQADRYNLAKQVSTIDYDTATGYLNAFDKNGNRALADKVPVDKLEDYIGKDLAKKLLATEPYGDDEFGQTIHRLEGVDLQTGGEGMKAFYDKMLVDSTNKYIKKWGTKVGATEIEGGDGKKYKLHSFDITPEMKKEVMEKGQPLYSIRPPEGSPEVMREHHKYFSKEEQSAREKVMAAMSDASRDPKGMFDRLFKHFSAENSAAVDRLRRNYFDRDARIERLSNIIPEMKDAATSAIASIRFFRNSDLFMHGALENGRVEYKKGHFVIEGDKGLTKIFQPIIKNYQKFFDYAAAMREQDLDPSLRRMTDADRNNFLNYAKEHPEFVTAQKEYQEFSRGLVKLLHDTGRIDKRSYDYLTSKNYLPFYKKLDDTLIGPQYKQALTEWKLHKLQGKDLPMNDPLENVLLNTRLLINMSMGNVAANRVMRDALQVGWADHIKEPKEIRAAKKSKSSNLITTYVNGKKAYFHVKDPLLYETMTVAPPELGAIAKMLSGPAHLLRASVVANPAFALFRNPTRDIVDSWAQGNFKTSPFVSLIRGYKEAYGGFFANGLERGDFSEGQQALIKRGVLAGQLRRGSVEGTAQELIDEMLGKRSNKYLEKVKEYIDRSEAVGRVPVYQDVLAKTGSEAEAAYRALEVMNFGRKGVAPWLRDVTAIIPFLNPRLQGIDKLVRLASGMNPGPEREAIKKLFKTRMAYLTAASLVYSGMMHGIQNEAYLSASPEERDNNWFLPLPDGEAIKIPIPFEIGAVTKILPERVWNQVFGKETPEDFGGSMKRTVTSTLELQPIPQALLPAFESMANYSTYRGRPLEPRTVQGEMVEDRYDDYTSGTAKAISKGIGDFTRNTLGTGPSDKLSPIRIDNMLKGYLGPMAVLGLNIADSLFGETTPEKHLYQWPVIGSILARPDGPKKIIDLYELKAEADEFATSYKKKLEEGEPEEAKSIMEKGRQKMAIRSSIDGIARNITDLNKVEKAIKRRVASGEMSKGEGTRQLDRIRDVKLKLGASIDRLKSE